jgi:hypothetical protein
LLSPEARWDFLWKPLKIPGFLPPFMLTALVNSPILDHWRCLTPGGLVSLAEKLS